MPCRCVVLIEMTKMTRPEKVATAVLVFILVQWFLIIAAAVKVLFS